jgi:TRAP-type C4-dicarboxylate transport system substrate-binding protein
MSFEPSTLAGRKNIHRPHVHAIVLIAALLGRTAAPAWAADPVGDVVRLKAAHGGDETFAWHKGFERFRDVVRAKSNNTMEVQIFPGGQLGTEKDYIQYLVQGVLDLTTVSSAAASGLAREAGFLDLMCLWKDHDHWQRSLDSDLGRQMADILEKGTAKGGNPGFHVLGYWGGSELHVASRTHGYQALKELSGVKLRIQDSPLQQEMWKQEGVMPLFLPLPATLHALQSGAIDGVDGNLVTFLNTKVFEAAPHISQTGHFISVRPLFISGHTWRRLNSAQQQVVLEAAKEATAIARSSEMQQAQQAEVQLKAKPGVHFYAFKEKQQMREQTQTIRQRVALDLGLESLLQTVDEGWAESKPRKR